MEKGHWWSNFVSILELKLSRINRTQTWLCFEAIRIYVESVFVGGFIPFGSNYKMHTGACVISNACTAPLRNGKVLPFPIHFDGRSSISCIHEPLINCWIAAEL